MKKTFITNITVALGLTFSLNAAEVDCANSPIGMELAKTLEKKDLVKGKLLLEKFKVDVKTYLKSCGNSKDKFEETSVMILTYEDRLADFEADLKNSSAEKIDCSKVPDSKALEKAFKKDDSNKVKALYETYKKDSEGYLDLCAAHEEYEIVFEEALLHEETYAEWQKSLK